MKRAHSLQFVLLFFSLAAALPSAIAQVVIATVPVGINPYGVAVDSAINKIYVPNCGNDPSCTASPGTVTVIDGATNTVIATVNVGVRPEAVAVDSATHKIYVANNCGSDKLCGSVGTVTVIDPNNNYKTVSVKVGFFPIALAVDSMTDQIYVVNSCGNDFECQSAGTVTVIDGGTNNVVATVPVGYSPESIAANAGNNQIYVANNCGDSFVCVDVLGTVTVIDGASNTVATIVNVGFYPNYLDLDSRTNKVYVSNLCGSDFTCNSAGTATVIDANNNYSTVSVPVEYDPVALAVNSDTHQIYVSNNYGDDPKGHSAGTVTVIDANNNTTTVNVGYYPGSLAIDSATNGIDVLNSCGNDPNCRSPGTVTVINGATNSTVSVAVGNDYPPPPFPSAVAVNALANTTYVVNRPDATVSVISGAQSYTLTVSTGGQGTVTSTDGFINCPSTCSYSYPQNTPVTLNATPASGWTFSGWSGACSGTGSCMVTMTQNLSVGATFTQLSYTLTVSTSGQGTVKSTDGSINCPGTCSNTYLSNTQVTLNATPAQGWTFTGWSGACSGTGSCVVTMTQNQSVGATFTQLSYNLTVSTSGQGTVTSTDGFINCPGMCSHSYLSNTQVTLNATAASGWSFSGWSGACSGTGSCSVTMTQAQSVGATFTQLSFTLTVSTSGQGTVTSTDGFINCPGTCSHSYLSNTQVTLNATPASGWTFSGWSGACSGTGSCSVTMTQAQSATATFTQGPTYILLVSTTGSGTVTSTDGFINCPGACSHSYPQNTPVTLSATPANGWAFSGWSGACSGTGSCVVTMTQNQSVGATFTQLSYILTVSVTGTGVVTSTDGFINCPGTCNNTYLSNTQVTLNATPAQGWNFTGWSGACSGTGSCVVTMTQKQSVGATFTGNGALQFVPVTPCRLVDTRNPDGEFGGPPIQGGTFRNFAIPDNLNCGIPNTAAAYSLNVTVVPHEPLGYLTIWPTGQQQPGVSTLNSLDGRVKANAAIVPAGANEAVSVFASNTTDVVLDIDGYFEPVSSSTLAFYTLPPCRVADTRQSSGYPQGLGAPSLAGGVARQFPILEASSCNIPPSAAAYSLNFTAVPHEPLGYLTVWPFGQSQPMVSTLNAPTGVTTANAAIVPAGTDPEGSIEAFASNNTDLVIDINGYFAPAGPNGLSLYTVAPCRVLDTRPPNGNGQFVNELTVDVVGSVCAPPSTAQAYVFNATVVPPGPLGYLTLWPDGGMQPGVSTLNAIDGAITSNMAIVPNSDGSTDAFASNLTQLILDISSYFAP